MSTFNAGQMGSDIAALMKTAPDKYISLGELLKYNAPDNRELLIKTYGDQGITGFLELTGATKSVATADEVTYWEEGRLHKTLTTAGAGLVGGGTPTGTLEVTPFGPGEEPCRPNDTLLTAGGQRLVVISVNNATDNLTVRTMNGANIVDEPATGNHVTIFGNIYAQGTDQPTEFYDTDVKKRINPFFITKEVFKVNGSQATNIGWIEVSPGEYRWYVKGEMDTRKRFMNQREMMMLLSALVPESGTGNISIPGGTTTSSEGYFDAVEDRGIVATGEFDAIDNIDQLILLLDAQGATPEYAMFLNTKASLEIDNMLAAGIATAVNAGLPGQFGAFQNSPDLAVQLGFKSFTRGGYTFHKNTWKLLNDPTLLGGYENAVYRGAAVPLTTVADPKTGEKSPALEMNYKMANGYSRELEHWVTGGALGYTTDGQDVARFNYRSEVNLITRAANRHIVFKG